MTAKPAIIIIDDEAQIRKILKISLESSGYKIIEAETGKDGILQTATNHPQLVILDLGLPDQDGFTVLKEIREWTNIPVIILSVRNSEDDIVKALEAGADDYIIKPFNTSELIARIKANLRRSQITIDSSIITNGELKIDLTARMIFKNDVEIKLTNLEYLLLDLFFKNIGKVLTHNFILKEVWGPGYTENSQYLRVFVGQIRKKIEDDYSTPKYITTESGVGYRMRPVNLQEKK